jgi:hypothetical protein
MSCAKFLDVSLVRISVKFDLMFVYSISAFTDKVERNFTNRLDWRKSLQVFF